MNQTESKFEKILVTAALPYINNLPHLGHIVGSHLPADIFARYCRSKGMDVMFVGGSDDNGTPAVLAAKELGVDIETFERKTYEIHKKIYDWFEISYDNFSRTSRPVHHATTIEFFNKIKENGFISEKTMDSFYCEQDERFLPDRYVKGNCPSCGYDEAFGDQCEKCGSFLEDLLDPKCTLCGKPPVIKQSNHLFLDLDKVSENLESWLESKKLSWAPQVVNQALSWIKSGLKPRCITRDLEHGIKVPVKGYEDKVFYVWFDAPIGYISATKESTPEWESYWKNRDSKIFHFLGKDNIPFHTIFWPGMLIANGEFNMPYKVVGLQYLNYGGKKFSKSKKRGVFCEGLMESKLDPEIMRSYLSLVIPETNDTEFRWGDFKSKTNEELIGVYGNFINRTLSFIHNKMYGKIKRPDYSTINALDRDFLLSFKRKAEEIETYLDKTNIKEAYKTIMDLAKEGNRYFDYNAPWNTIKVDQEKTNKTLYMCAALCKSLAIFAQPYLPKASKKIFRQLNLDEKELDKKGVWQNAYSLDLPEYHSINAPKILFEKITDQDIEYLKYLTSNPGDISKLFK